MNDYGLLAASPLFRGASPEEIKAMIGCLGTRERTFADGERIWHMGDTTTSIGLVLEGAVRIESVDVWGNVSVMRHAGTGQLFGEAYAACGEPLKIDVVAVGSCRILFLEAAKVLTTCSIACPHHARVSTNMVAAISRQCISLSQRIFHTAPKSIRGKVLSYLSTQAELAGCVEFDIPFNRQQLADYLGVDRSALSAELSRMTREGLIETSRSHFKLLDIG
ncbi:MAG TPA: Crp/Fnr family transcriptional regulator [Eggerthellaceae bacterium]|nr:Crp/Fnr family transcriptional regulator [Eggerthellaceae bacterium]